MANMAAHKTFYLHDSHSRRVFLGHVSTIFSLTRHSGTVTIPPAGSEENGLGCIVRGGAIVGRKETNNEDFQKTVCLVIQANWRSA